MDYRFIVALRAFLLGSIRIMLRGRALKSLLLRHLTLSWRFDMGVLWLDSLVVRTIAHGTETAFRVASMALTRSLFGSSRLVDCFG